MVERRKFSRATANLSPSLPHENGGCGCNQPPAIPSTRCKALLGKLQSLDFSIVDTVLYLDAYPDSREALSHYHKLCEERDALLRALREDCRMPMTSFENASRDSWDWTKGPWPWEADANEMLSGENQKGRDRYVAL
ncbi:MAG: spore coat protein CotJB [Clostridia bacterium]|nr:spore coat protein CotJB [Clostridia bacterium]